MVFSAPLFLFGFLPIFLLLYGVSLRGWLNFTALSFSAIFYAWGEPIFVFVVIASALVDFALVRTMATVKAVRRRRILLTIGVSANIGLLAWFKYANFASASSHSLAKYLFDADLPILGTIALPIGISFIVFEKITYIVDVYRGVGAPAKRLTDYLLYVILFPKLLAGPIVKYHDIERQLEHRPRRLDDLAEGLRRFSIGLAKKILIADAAGELADAVFAPGPSVGFTLAWLGTLAFAVQIFFDFSGYSDMAIGLARTMGFRIMENFNRPYLAIGFGDFWRRWHISLSTWIRDYLYIPLGGDRVSTIRTYVNLWICFLASGLWHGAAWTFVAWGAYHGLFLTLDRLFMRRVLLRLPRAAAIGVTFVAVTMGWVIFRAPDLPSAAAIMATLADPGRTGERTMIVTADLYAVVAIGLALCFAPAIPAVARLQQALMSLSRWKAASLFLAAGLLAISVAKATTVDFNPFLYFRF